MTITLIFTLTLTLTLISGSLLHILCQCQKAIKEEPQGRIAWRHDSVLAIYKGVKDRIKEATESGRKAQVEDSIGFKSNLGKFTCSYYIFLCRFLRTCEPQALVDTLESSEC